MKGYRRPRILFLSTYPPRGCGIATFTNDIVTELKKRGHVYPQVVAIDDGQNSYDEDVIAQIDQQDEGDYAKAADIINRTADLLMVEHEYGIYGGQEGEFLRSLVRMLSIPYMITCHTVLPSPGDRQKNVLTALCRGAAGVVAMSEQSRVMLRDIYGVAEKKIQVIHHGVPVLPFIGNREQLKDEMSLSGHTVITTFGLLSPGKGLDYGISAVAEVVRRHPNIRYMILGQTHPAIMKQSGEAYRESLMALVDRLGINENVMFINRYLSQSEIMRYLYLSDIYMTPYLSKDQAVSGTMAYAIGCGRAVVSTPYIYATEMLAEGRGLLADFKSSKALARCLNILVEDPIARSEMEKRALILGRTMSWPQVTAAYENAFMQYISSLAEIRKEGFYNANERAAI